MRYYIKRVWYTCGFLILVLCGCSDGGVDVVVQADMAERRRDSALGVSLEPLLSDSQGVAIIGQFFDKKGITGVVRVCADTVGAEPFYLEKTDSGWVICDK